MLVLWWMACQRAEVEPAPTPRQAPTLLVLVVVDQLPTRLLDRAQPLFTAGFARLTGSRAFHGVGRYAHGDLSTCPGHATISTGAAPSVHGIVANDWHAPGTAHDASVYCGDIALLRSETLADSVIAAGGQVASLAIKDRAAIMLGGRSPTAETWLDKDSRRFRPPVDDLPLDAYYATEWTALYPDRYSVLAGVDDAPDEADPGIGTTFPHQATTNVPTAFPSTPFAGTALTDAAIALSDRLGLGTDDHPDLLAISYSEVDYIGHAYTSESWEALDDLVRLDLDLGRLMDHLDASVGPDRYAVVLTSDHGSVRPTGLRIPPGAIDRAADQALVGAGFAAGVTTSVPSVWLPDALRADPSTRARAAGAVVDALRAVPGLAEAWAWRDAPVGGPHAAAILQSVDPERSGDVYLMLGEGVVQDRAGQEGKGTSHGSPYPDENRVPLLAVGAGIAPGVPVDEPDLRQVAPTAAALLGIRAPSSATLPVIDRMLVEASHRN